MLEVRREVVLSWRSRVHRGLVIRVAIVLEIRIFIRVLIFVLDLVLGLLIVDTGAAAYKFLLSSVLLPWRGSSSSSKISTKGQ